MASGLQGFRASGLQGFRASGRDSVLDSLRGLAIILVATGHLITSLRQINIDFRYSNDVWNFIYSFHMPLFFMIAGYAHGMKDRYSGGKGYFQHAQKALVDLYIPCITLSLIYFLTKYFLLTDKGIASEIPSIRDIHMGLALYWFLEALFSIKLLHLLFECKVKNIYAASFFWAMVFIMTSLFRFCLPELILRLSYGIFFHAGYFIHRKNIMPQVKRSYSVYGAVMILAGALCFFVPHVRGGADTFTRTAAAMCVSLGLFTAFYALGINIGFLSLCGVYSMVIYALHSYGFVALKLAYKLLGMSSFIHPAVFYVIGLLAGVVMPLILVWVYKNVKCFRWIEYIFYPGKLILSK